MIVEYIRYLVANPNRGKELLAAYAVAAKQLDDASECLSYELSNCEEDGNSWILRIEWRSTEEHLQSFRKGPLFPAFLAAIKNFIPEISEMRHYSPTSVTSGKEGGKLT